MFKVHPTQTESPKPGVNDSTSHTDVSHEPLTYFWDQTPKTMNLVSIQLCYLKGTTAAKLLKPQAAKLLLLSGFLTKLGHRLK